MIVANLKTPIRNNVTFIQHGILRDGLILTLKLNIPKMASPLFLECVLIGLSLMENILQPIHKELLKWILSFQI